MKILKRNRIHLVLKIVTNSMKEKTQLIKNIIIRIKNTFSIKNNLLKKCSNYKLMKNCAAKDKRNNNKSKKNSKKKKKKSIDFFLSLILIKKISSSNNSSLFNWHIKKNFWKTINQYNKIILCWKLCNQILQKRSKLSIIIKYSASII